VVVWRLMANGYSDFAITNTDLSQYPDAPWDRSTVSKLRKEFSDLQRPELVQAIKAEPVLKRLLKDEQILYLMVKAFCRPAFETSIQHESSVPDFMQALTDTIKVLTTGYLDTRDGKGIEVIPNLDDLKDTCNKNTLHGIVKKLNLLKTMCVTGQKDGSIKQKGNVWIITPKVAHCMENLRCEILGDFERIYPNFKIECFIMQLS